MAGSTRFTDAMALTLVSSDDVSSVSSVFAGELNEHWTIGPKVHGGAMLALCANAAKTTIGGQERSDRGIGTGGLEPIAVSGSFLWAPDPGPVQVVTTLRKRGRRVSVVDVELRQGDRTAVRTVITLGSPEARTSRRCCRSIRWSR